MNTGPLIREIAEDVALAGKRPLAIDLFCGLGGWTEGFLAEGWDVVGFDIERRPYPAQLVIQDVLTLHGSQFRDAAVIVASPPCQAYSYRAMPWKRAKALPPPDNSLFEACFRIAEEASVPIIVENVRGAQPWVGRAKYHFGSFYLWGDLPALMPKAFGAGVKCGGPVGNDWFTKHNRPEFLSWFNDKGAGGETSTARFGSKSPERISAAAQIAKIPFPLARHIAQCFKPQLERKCV